MKSFGYLALACVVATILASGLRSGKFRSRLIFVYRDQEPVRYWSMAIARGIIAAVLLALGLLALRG
jgi:hypothetical protein